MKNKIKKFAVLALVLTLLSNNVALAAEDSINPFQLKAYGIDTIAGFTAAIHSSQTLPNKTVIFTIEKPDKSELYIPVESDDKGIAELDLYDYHTKKAGEYTIWARLETGKNGDSNTFTVYPDEVSEIKSTVSSSNLLSKANGIDKVYLTVNLQDAYGNPIQGHSIEAVSSRTDDTVNRVSEKSYTNSQGTMIFSVSSESKGVSIYSFIDTTSNKVLNERIEIAYTSLKDVGGHIPTAYAQAGEISGFEFTNLPTTILPNSDVSFTLEAVDSEGEVVPNYAGTVHFSVEGSNSIYASVPNDYSFDIDFDLGVHEFSGINSLNFSQQGTYAIVATDKDEFTFRGETSINVGTGTIPSPTVTPEAGAAEEVVIQNPTPGTYSSGMLTISGIAPAGLTIQIFDNDQNIGSTPVKPDGTFSFQPSLLLSGEHKLFAAALDSNGVIQSTSDEVLITIDISGPQLTDIIFDPASGIKTGELVNITVITEETVFQGAVVFNVDIAELDADPTDSTKYFASIQAPAQEGTYPVDVILVDELGNEGLYEGVANLEVTVTGDAVISTAINGDQEPTTPSEPSGPVVGEPVFPSDVFGVRATSSDQRVTLTWQPASSDLGIKNYRILYGTSAANLDMFADTLDNTTTWYIPNLQNGTEYFFAVLAIDNDDNESLNPSSIISSIPFSAGPVTEPPAIVEPDLPVAPTMQASGPEFIWFILFSLLASQLYFKYRKKV